jgi:hypothetical protein
MRKCSIIKFPQKGTCVFVANININIIITEMRSLILLESKKVRLLSYTLHAFFQNL